MLYLILQNAIGYHLTIKENKKNKNNNNNNLKKKTKSQFKKQNKTTLTQNIFLKNKKLSTQNRDARKIFKKKKSTKKFREREREREGTFFL